MELSQLLMKLKKLGYENDLYFLSIEAESGNLIVSDIQSPNRNLISDLADDQFMDYVAKKAENQIPILYQISFF